MLMRMPKPNLIRDLIGIALVVLTGFLYMAGVTEASTACDCEPGTGEAVGASFEVEAPAPLGSQQI